MKGEMKSVKALYLRALALSDGRDGHDFDSVLILLVTTCRSNLRREAYLLATSSVLVCDK